MIWLLDCLNLHDLIVRLSQLVGHNSELRVHQQPVPPSYLFPKMLTISTWLLSWSFYHRPQTYYHHDKTNNLIFSGELFKWICNGAHNSLRCFASNRMKFWKLYFLSMNGIENTEPFLEFTDFPSASICRHRWRWASLTSSQSPSPAGGIRTANCLPFTRAPGKLDSEMSSLSLEAQHVI